MAKKKIVLYGQDLINIAEKQKVEELEKKLESVQTQTTKYIKASLAELLRLFPKSEYCIDMFYMLRTPSTGRKYGKLRYEGNLLFAVYEARKEIEGKFHVREVEFVETTKEARYHLTNLQNKAVYTVYQLQLRDQVGNPYPIWRNENFLNDTHKFK